MIAHRFCAAKAATRFLSRLRRDDRGNVLIVVGASMLPLLAMMGSGVDLTRAYMAQARLQQACDAGALAGRRVMTGGVVNGAVTDEAKKFFNFNFPQNLWNTASFTPVITQGPDSTVVIKASTTINTEIMRLFGFDTLPLEVECDAKQDFLNTDIVLVLDTTGSMAQFASSGDTDTKIVALRKAVMALYDELSTVQTKLEAAGLRLRYGVVPYSSSINVGQAIIDANPAYMVSDQWTYQSRQMVSGAWSYRPYSLDVSHYVKFETVPTPSRAPGSSATSKWDGCIEERETVSTITSSSGYTIPSGAYDLDIDMIPTSDNATKWRPYWRDVVYRPDNLAQATAYCPTAAQRLRTWTRSEMSAYVDSLRPDGNTYHDNGMIWGARFISRGGIFAGDNPATYANMPVARHIIFMTDGQMVTGPTVYSTYGMENWDKRVTGGYTTDADSNARHDQRFRMMCAATKQMGVSIWVIAFASSLSSSLSNCATSAGQASTSANSASLTAKFVDIGKSIGALRLSQ